MRLFLAVTASHKWDVHAIDVKGAFLQGKEITREVYIRPPKEANTTKVWLLRKCAYGLSDAPRCWYLKVREELLKLGASPSTLDNGIFLFTTDDSLIGIVIIYVDDFMWSGVEDHMRPHIDAIKQIFKISQESDTAFTYIGVRIIQNKDKSIFVNRKAYAEAISP